MNIGKRSACSSQSETAAIDDGAAERRAVAAHELGQRMDDDVGAVLDRPQQDRRRHGVVDDQRHAVALGDLGERLDIADIAGRIADAFAEDGARLGVDQLLDRFGAIALGKADRDALARQDVTNSVWVVP